MRWNLNIIIIIDTNSPFFVEDAILNRNMNKFALKITCIQQYDLIKVLHNNTLTEDALLSNKGHLVLNWWMNVESLTLCVSKRPLTSFDLNQGCLSHRIWIIDFMLRCVLSKITLYAADLLKNFKSCHQSFYPFYYVITWDYSWFLVHPMSLKYYYSVHLMLD